MYRGTENFVMTILRTIAGALAGNGIQFSYLFSDLHQLVAGAIPNPPTLSGVNLQQVLWLQWEEGRNNTPGNSTIDLWIDDVEFY